MATYQQDRFDEIPRDLSRVGAHRGPRSHRRAWVTFAWAALASGVLVLAGIFTLSLVDPRFAIQLPWAGTAEPTDTETDGPAPTEATVITDPGTVDPALDLSISILNASPTAGAQTTADDQLTALGWPVASALPASADDIETTTIYYRSSDYQAIARGLAQVLGVGALQLSDAYPGAPVTIVLGADYAPTAG